MALPPMFARMANSRRKACRGTALLALACCWPAISLASNEDIHASLPAHHTTATNPYTLIVFYEANTNLPRLVKSVRQYGGKVIYQYDNFNAIAVSMTGTSKKEALHHLKSLKDVLQVNVSKTQSVQTSQ